jgi:hypothetical protein
LPLGALGAVGDRRIDVDDVRDREDVLLIAPVSRLALGQ